MPSVRENFVSRSPKKNRARTDVSLGKKNRENCPLLLNQPNFQTAPWLKETPSLPLAPATHVLSPNESYSSIHDPSERMAHLREMAVQSRNTFPNEHDEQSQRDPNIPEQSILKNHFPFFVTAFGSWGFKGSEALVLPLRPSLAVARGRLSGAWALLLLRLLLTLPPRGCGVFNPERP